MLINGQWVEKWQPVQASDDEGRFLRPDSGFRNPGADGPGTRALVAMTDSRGVLCPSSLTQQHGCR